MGATSGRLAPRKPTKNVTPFAVVAVLVLSSIAYGGPPALISGWVSPAWVESGAGQAVPPGGGAGGVTGTGVANQVAVWSTPKKIGGITGFNATGSPLVLQMADNSAQLYVQDATSHSIFDVNVATTVVEIGQGNNAAVLKLYRSAGGDALAVQNNGGRIHHGAGAFDYSSSDGTTVTYASPLAWSLTADNVDVGNAGNVATAQALPSCSATDSTLQYSTGSHAFQCVSTAAVSTFSAWCNFAAFTADTNCLGGYVASKGTEKLLTAAGLGATIQVGTAGSGGTTAMEVDLVDILGPTTVASDSTHFPCNTAANTPIGLTFTSFTMVAGRTYVARLHTKGNCTTGPLNPYITFNFNP